MIADHGDNGELVTLHSGIDLANASDGAVESREVRIARGFDQAVVSWNARTPPGSYLTALVQCRVGSTWTGWYNMGLWNRDGRPRPRTSFKGQDDEFGSVDTDTLVLKRKADAFRVRVEMGSDGGASPALRFMAVSVIDSTLALSRRPPVEKTWGRELRVPELSQLSVEGGRGWCSPTSVAMALGYWADKLEQPELRVGIAEAANGIHDEAWEGTGNWSFNVAYAGEFEGIRAYVTRFDSVSQIEQWTLRGVPVIVSLHYPTLTRGRASNTGGHLMVVRGFTRRGNPIFNDPWTRLESGEKVRKVFSRGDFENAWLGPSGSRGTVYLIYPEAWQ